MAMNAGFAAFLAKKKAGTTAKTNVPPMMNTSNAPMIPMHPQMVAAIKASPKGKIPPGLAKYLANKKKGGNVAKSGKGNKPNKGSKGGKKK